ncbi:MAG: nucleotidyltransferase [Ruminococcaceae bacterium]|nr:nucleotidyltransferase [Oscillospiraceae bacterium]
MQQPTLVVMAAGMGSRFGGLKQLMPVDEQGHPIIDFSMFDARRAGFQRVVFIIKKAIEQQFRETIGQRMERFFDVSYVFQELDRLPAGYQVPEGRSKPWGTGHAVACCRGVVDGPFAVINADDFYGAGAFRTIYAFLAGDHARNEHAMVGYRLRNTVTENGAVARGICTVENGMLRDVEERVKIEKRGDAAAYIEDGREYPLTGDETVSMNFWGFSPAMLDELWARFPAFLDERLGKDGRTCEYYLPVVANTLLQAGLATVRVLECGEVWHGVTYREDLQSVKEAVAALKQAGVYPASLWE